MTPRELLARLVAFDTTSAKTNLPLLEFITEYLRQIGVRTTLVHDDTGAKANLWATIGPEHDGGVVLSGHTDVVPVAGQQWDSDPFHLDERGERLYGRGTADMKSFLAVALALAPDFARARLRAPVHFAFSYDEEVGCLGVRKLIPFLIERGVRPAAVVVGEPTSMQVVTAHKGIRTFRTTVTGVEAHSSRSELGLNAIMYAAKLIAFLRNAARDFKNAADPRSGYEPPYPTVNVGMIEGGTALNIVPRTCSFLWEVRTLPGGDDGDLLRRFDAFAREEVLPVMRAEAPSADIVTTPSHRVPAFADEADSPATTLALALAGKNEALRVSYGSEAGLFRQAGFSTVLCGPGDIADAHRPNESVALAQIEQCVAFQRGLLRHLAA
ncbi:MAG: acetylornithine deacetylase [Alphaproteobacteria bacterium]|nr:acetylornithine deacetylase [Alphaproteobacteria bacterium]